MRRFVTSDSHGGYATLFQCLERCGFNMEEDQLIFLGDVVDGWSETKESINLLLCIKNLMYILGNHDQWTLNYYSGKMADSDADFDQDLNLWLMQGGAATIKSYGVGKHMPQDHLQLLQNAKPYFITEDNMLFVHAGFDTSKPIEKTNPDYLIWNRDFVKHYYSLHVSQQPIHIDTYDKVFIGHTPTIALNKAQTTPLDMGNITLIDTGAAFTGCLSIINIDSKEFWQSDKVMSLYPFEKGRNSMNWNERKQSGLI